MISLLSCRLVRNTVASGRSDLLEDGAVLNEYAVTGRYPGDLAFESIRAQEASEAVQAAEHIAGRVGELFTSHE